VLWAFAAFFVFSERRAPKDSSARMAEPTLRFVDNPGSGLLRKANLKHYVSQ
jgi:hypothetical protein